MHACSCRRCVTLASGPSTLLDDAAAPDLLESGIELLRPLDRRLTRLLLRIVSDLPSAERPGSDESMRSTLAGVVLDHAGSTSGGERIAAAALRALFGPTLPPAVRRRFATEAERVARAGEFGPEAATALLRVLGRADDTPAQIEGQEDSARDAAIPVTEVPIARGLRRACDGRSGGCEERAAAARGGEAATRRDRGRAAWRFRARVGSNVTASVAC